MARDGREIRRILNNNDLRVETLDEATSTNALLLARAEMGEPEGLILCADRQTAGRGRSGRTFFSPEGAGVYTSILLRPKLSMGQIEKLTPLAAVAVCETLEEIAGCHLQIKWVNDVYRDGRKICGILAQASKTFTGGIPDHVVLGIGIDLFPPKEDIPREIRNVAGSLLRDPGEIETCLSNPRFREKVIGRLWKRFYEMYRDPDEASYVASYRSRLMWVGDEIVAYDGADGAERVARLKGLTDDYALLLQFDGEDALTAVRTGEIRIRRSL